MPIINTFNNYGGQVNIADHIGHISFTPAFTKEQFSAFMGTLELPDNEAKEVQTIWQEADKQGLDEVKVNETLEQLQLHLEEIKSILPAPAAKQVEEVKKLQTGMSFDGKFKTTIPIIPFILNYEMEAKSNLKDVFKQIWKDIKNGEFFLRKNDS